MDGKPAFQHPTEETLKAFGLGKLEDILSNAVHQHLEGCSPCRSRVSEISADPFLIRIRQAQKEGQAARSEESLPSYGVTKTVGKPQGPPPAETLPTGFADHPDYQILRELGRGGMGVVYLAHNRLMGRDEVLKVMSKRLMDHPGGLDRFLREIRAVAKFRHPNIVAAYSAIWIGESLVFSMEYVEGLDLSKLVKAKGPLSVAHACHFAYQAALGLQHAHEAGLIHRDIKPANLMLTRVGKKATIKVLDFGLAKVTREAKLDDGLTLEGQALGTPDYNAPEQILDAQSADIRADIYSLGCTLYYLLAGRPPFKAQSLYDMYQAHISRDAETLNFVRPEVPSELGALVAKMMAKDPARRFQTPGEVAEALKPFFKPGAAGFQRPEMDLSIDANRRGGFRTPSPQRLASTGAQARSKPVADEPRWETLLNFGEPEVDVSPPCPHRADRPRDWQPGSPGQGGILDRLGPDVPGEPPRRPVLRSEACPPLPKQQRELGRRA